MMEVKSVLYIPVDGFLRQYLTLNHDKYKIMVEIYICWQPRYWRSYDSNWISG